MGSSRRDRRSNSRDRDKRRDRRDHFDERREERPSRKRTREQSPLATKRRRSRSVERERDYEYTTRHRAGNNYEERTVRRLKSSSRERELALNDFENGAALRHSRSGRNERRQNSRDSRRTVNSSWQKRSRRSSRNMDSYRDNNKYEREHEQYSWRGDNDNEGEWSRRDEVDYRHRDHARQRSVSRHREFSRQRESSRHKKRSRSRSHRGKKKRSRREALVEDDEEGHLIFSKGDIIQDRYRIIRELGEGTFGKVVECEDLAKKKLIAIKIIKNVKKYRDAAKLEINVLKKLYGYDPDCRFKCVQMYDWFDYHGHKCIAFQLLGKSVFDFLKDNNYEPYPIEHVRSIAYELTLAVNFIHTHHLTHTDLKPENILFFDSSKTKTDKKTRKEVLLNPEIRLIDFGSATFDHEHHSSIIQTRHYRAPEVILKLGWSQSCDTWSIGCIIIELALGYMLFDTHNSMEHLAMMERILGKIPTQMALQSNTSYFSKGALDWNCESKEGRYVRRKVKQLERYIPKEERENRDWLDMFDLIRRMLEYDPEKRIRLPVALDHPFLQKYNLRKPSRSSSGYESR
eukprot:TRINITY_DN6330_c0_g1_i1.p1 TRINITY_DN6330_c0_g1~~TRINITY_DN6330_c0_g1_i1.p1  ORF type:complete len:573 (-),score=104.11 TRINITY_DN6330_c0_g1_i1:1256-2974(-)